jgi:hypothetical protein
VFPSNIQKVCDKDNARKSAAGFYFKWTDEKRVESVREAREKRREARK